MKLSRTVPLALVALAFSIVGTPAQALNNNLAVTPPMGWNSWNNFNSNINETIVKQTADALVSSGLAAAGYVYVNIDGGWWVPGGGRDANGVLLADATKFPSGIKAVADYVHSKGLKLGIYSNWVSFGHETTDANTFASWGVDYLKYDCYHSVSTSGVYETMRDALANCGRPIVFSINWDLLASPLRSDIAGVVNLWRTTQDINDYYSLNTYNVFPCGTLQIIDRMAMDGVTGTNTWGCWADPDMLEVGNGGQTADEYRTQMSLWCMFPAPLILGNDVRSMTQATKDILMNAEVIAVNQDPAGQRGVRIKKNGDSEVWSKQLGDATGTRAVVLMNRATSAANITVNWSEIGLTGTAAVRDLWAKTDRGSFSGSYTASVPAHGVVMVKIAGTNAAVPASLVVDNTDAGWSSDSAWATSSSTAGYTGANYAMDGTAGADSSSRWAKWTPSIAVAGYYNIYMNWTAFSNRPTAAPVQIQYNGGFDTSKTVNQQANGGTWVLLGNYDLSGGGNYVKILATNAGYTIADAVKFEVTDLVIDNENAEFTTDSAWSASSATAGYLGSNYLTDGTAGANPATRWAKWTPDIPVAGHYNIYLNWTAYPNRPSAAPLEIKYNGGTDTSKTVNQQANGGTWVLVGNYSLAAGTSNYVKLLATASGYTVADAVRFQYTGP